MLEASLKVSFCNITSRGTKSDSNLQRASEARLCSRPGGLPFRAGNSNSDHFILNMPVSRQQIIIRVFRKYSHSLGPEELEYLDDILKEHDISDEDVEMSIELIAKEYNKQDGSSLVSHLGAGGAHAPLFFSTRCYHEGFG
jgi:hypothetical protein